MYSYSIPFYYTYPIPDHTQIQAQNSFMSYYIPQQNFCQGPQFSFRAHQANIEVPSNISRSQQAEQVPKQEKDLAVSKKKKICIQKTRERDQEFKQRQQTANRNLCSNTLKVYLKQARDTMSETYRSICKVIEIYNLQITAEQYVNKLNSSFPGNRTYVSFQKLKKMCGDEREDKLTNHFGIILRITFKRFFLHEIHMICIKSVRTTRKIRNQQIKQGRIFLKEMNH